MVKRRISGLTITLGMLITFVLAGCGSSRKMINVKSRWQDDYLHLGNKQTPSLEHRRYLPEQQIYYSFSNDNDNLYVMLEMVKKQVTAKMLFAGATLWINTDGKAKQTMGLKYPLAAEGGAPGSNAQSADQTPGERLKALIADKRRLTLIGIRGKEPTEINHLEPGAVNAKIWLDERSGHLMYLARIPFRAIGIEEASPQTNIAIGFKTGSIDRPDRHRYTGGRRRTGRRRRPRRRRSPQDQKAAALTHPTEFWFNFSLSTRKSGA